MTHPADEPHSVFYQAFTRDGGSCVYCGKNLLASYDAFTGSCLDHLKPRALGGADHDPWNRVTSCSACHNLKGAFDPSPEGRVREETFALCIERARHYVKDKRERPAPTGLHRDYHFWVGEFARLGKRVA